MGYEDAAATKILATHCACCGRPLVDASSVEIGMGPVCRKKYGYNQEVPEAVREAANKIIYALALAVSTAAVTVETMKLALDLELLGFAKIANIFRLNGAAVFIEKRLNNGVERLFVRTPYSPEFNNASWVKGRYGVKVQITDSPSKKKVFHWTFDTSKETRATVHAALVQCFPGALAIGPNGPFIVRPLKTGAQLKAEAAAAETSQKAA